MANKAGIINADTGVIVGVPDALVQVGGVWQIQATGGAPGTVPSTRTISTTAPLAGGGDLSANRTLSIPAATAGNDGYMTSTQVGTLATAASTASTAQTTANAALPKAGGTMTGAIDMGNQKITSLGAPGASTDAATKGYVDTAVVGLLDLKGTIDCSTNPNYPAADKGDVYVVSVAGLIGGASGVAVQAGDALVALADNAGGTQAAVGSSWGILQANLIGALLAVNNLSDVQNVTTARTNLGLGTAATQNSTAFATAAQGTLASTAVQRAGDTMTGNLVISNSKLGINTSDPKYSIHARVSSETWAFGGTGFTPALSTGTDPNLLFGNGGGGFRFYGTGSGLSYATAQIDLGSDQNIKMSTGAGSSLPTERLRVTSTGQMQVLKGGTATITSTNAVVVRDTSFPYLQFINNSSGGAGTDGFLVGIESTYANIYVAEAWDLRFSTSALERMRIQSDGKIAIGSFAPTAVLHIKAGTATANTAPLKFTSGTNLTAAEAGAMEYNGTLSFTDSSAVRKDVALKTTYTPTLTPALIVSAGYTEQTFTVTGLTTTDTIIVNGPAAAANSVLVHARVSAADTLALTWITDAANITPTSGTYRIVAIRS